MKEEELDLVGVSLPAAFDVPKPDSMLSVVF